MDVVGYLQVGRSRRHPPVVVGGVWREVAEQDSVDAARDVVVVRRIHCLACVVLRSQTALKTVLACHLQVSRDRMQVPGLSSNASTCDKQLLKEPHKK